MADPAGYSGTPLDRKLGIAPETRLALTGDAAGLAPVRRALPEGVAADLAEDGVRAVAIPAGLVDLKVCAVDADWSGLKLVVPLARRPKASGTRTARAGSKGARGRSKS